MPRGVGRWRAEGAACRASVVDCGSPLPLLLADFSACVWQNARGLAHSKTWQQFERFMDSLLSLFRMHWDHEPEKDRASTRQRLGVRQPSAALEAPDSTNSVRKRQRTGTLQNLVAIRAVHGEEDRFYWMASLPARPSLGEGEWNQAITRTHRFIGMKIKSFSAIRLSLITHWNEQRLQ